MDGTPSRGGVAGIARRGPDRGAGDAAGGARCEGPARVSTTKKRSAHAHSSTQSPPHSRAACRVRPVVWVVQLLEEASHSAESGHQSKYRQQKHPYSLMIETKTLVDKLIQILSRYFGSLVRTPTLTRNYIASSS